MLDISFLIAVRHGHFIEYSFLIMNSAHYLACVVVCNQCFKICKSQGRVLAPEPWRRTLFKKPCFFWAYQSSEQLNLCNITDFLFSFFRLTKMCTTFKHVQNLHITTLTFWFAFFNKAYTVLFVLEQWIVSSVSRASCKCVFWESITNVPSVRKIKLIGFIEVCSSLLDSLLSANTRKLLDYFVAVLQVISEFSLFECRVGSTNRTYRLFACTGVCCLIQ